jgi:NADH dehydrogenase/NADH:ubiquinone oxidoreductase subunit G
MAQREKNAAPAQVVKVVKPIEKAPEASPINSGNDKLKKQLQRQADELEQQLEALKTEKLKVENLIADPANNAKIGTLSEQYQQLEQSVISKNKEFEAIFEQLLSL